MPDQTKTDQSAPPSGPLPKDFEDRQALEDFLKSTFEDVINNDQNRPLEEHLAPFEGGREPAKTRLEAVKPGKYKRTRNYLEGAVSRLSPYLRHGILSLAEVRDHALEKATRGEAEKYVNELAWRDYWQRVYHQIGVGVWQDREEYKTGFSARDYANDLPPDIPDAETGLACIDGFAEELHETGYLHNHARMYVASYVVHHRRVKWQAGAKWFLAHLLDGDPASNNLSWQWIGSTFSRKPYIWNRENLEKYSDSKYCTTCPQRHACPFDKSYETLSAQLFPHLEEDAA